VENEASDPSGEGGPRKLTTKWCKILASGHFMGAK